MLPSLLKYRCLSPNLSLLKLRRSGKLAIHGGSTLQVGCCLLLYEDHLFSWISSPSFFIVIVYRNLCTILLTTILHSYDCQFNFPVSTITSPFLTNTILTKLQTQETLTLTLKQQPLTKLRQWCLRFNTGLWL